MVPLSSPVSIVVLAGVDLESGDFSLVDEELGKRSHAEAVVLHFNKLIFDAVWTTQGENAEARLLRVPGDKLIDQMTSVGIIASVISLQHLSKGVRRKLVQARDLFLNVS
eukprot:CAMPEP_0185597860 /NCGR_PEP_ID=MMETSP0434-20130131/81629_1 /TAXON_ID=626734 ORGANISM="Favella taraikaensis, Strain Fe Narragansett Bay" /NCGR_SAMPLE_ID=MMETSP0434 /ASSEMBLY_ACC=CAM_ASM_000379 /LENGTH=109 /DNA_ID=CAMNT_0028226689 /DNA_START=2360 /DNA_END=2689 /DNA_ORIENTATION=+